MFPLDPISIPILVMLGVFLLSAMAVQFGGLCRIASLLLAIFLPAALLWSDPPIGEFAGLVYIGTVGFSVGMMLLGFILGRALQLAGLATLVSVAVLFITSSAIAGFELWRQYVPNACLENAIEVRVAGKTLHLPHELQPRLQIGASIYDIGRMDSKHSYARLCRMSHNGSKAVAMDAVSIYPMVSHEVMTAACKAHEPPTWCTSYNDMPYRHISRILIAPEAKGHGFPLPYWRPGGALNKDRQGDLISGSICLLPPSVTSCWTWNPFGEGSRLIVSTNNLDKIFIDMSAEEAREMISSARDMTLATISQ